jgi:hypothetical protein
MEEKMTQKRSLILQYFTPDLLTKLWLITKTSGASNNEKGQLVKETLRENNVPFSPLGSGTNRLGILIDGYSFKIALDEDGMIDNRREFLYTTKLQPYVIKVYEISPMGLIAVSEYFTLFTYDDYREHAEEMKDILKIVSRSFLIGDVGVTGKNYVNWGFREDGTIGMLDFAYIYSVDYKLFTCSCSDDAILVYDDDFVKLVCPQCGRKYTFGSIRKKVTKKQQEEEIGNMDEQGYILRHPVEKVPEIIRFEPKYTVNNKKKKELNETEKLIKEHRKAVKSQIEEITDYDELVDEIQSNYNC